jgi:MFS family permease
MKSRYADYSGYIYFGYVSLFLYSMNINREEDELLIHDVSRIIPVHVKEIVQSEQENGVVEYAWGTATLFLLFPIATSLWQVYVMQVILGIFGAMQRTGEKALIADLTEGKTRGKQIGTYHSWLAVFSGLAFMGGGYLIDLFTLHVIFYIGSVFLFITGFLILCIDEPKNTE